MRRVIVGLDVGTSSMKAVAVQEDGIIAEFITQEYVLPDGEPQGVVPLAVYESAMKQLLTVLSKNYCLVAISVTTQMYSLCGESDSRPAVYQWNCLWDRDIDTERNIGKELIRSGCRVDTLFPGYKLSSLQPEQRKKFLPYGLKEHLIYVLCGVLATDYSTASASGLFDAEKKAWNEHLIEKLGYEISGLPKIYQHDSIIGHVLLNSFDGANPETMVVPGLGDGPSASLACRSLSTFCGNLGTSMAARILTDTPDFSDENGLWNLAVDDVRFAVGGISSNSCTVLHWAEQLGIKIPEVLSETGNIKFFPWLHGERTPYWSSDLRATFTGLTIENRAGDIGSAIVKAVAFTFARIADTVGKVAPKNVPLVLLGGGTNSSALMSVITGCIDREIVLLKDETYLGAIGAAISACTAVDVPFEPHLKTAQCLKPDGKYREEYNAWVLEAMKLADRAISETK